MANRRICFLETLPVCSLENKFGVRGLANETTLAHLTARICTMEEEEYRGTLWERGREVETGDGGQVLLDERT